LRFDSAGLPFIGGAFAAALISGAAIGWILAIPFVALGLFFAFFFRDPERTIPPASNHVLSPADGRILVAGPAVPAAAPPPAWGQTASGSPAADGSWQQISIFLSPMDVHVNRIPASGRITHVDYKRGRFLPAYHADAAATNERSEIWIDHDGQTIVARQIVGILARRVVCRAEVGSAVQAGDRYGIMKFGSRMDIFVPSTAKITVAVGDVVRGGETVIAVLH
jgi:phosphatidylserine decarboxylase